MWLESHLYQTAVQTTEFTQKAAAKDELAEGAHLGAGPPEDKVISAKETER